MGRLSFRKGYLPLTIPGGVFRLSTSSRTDLGRLAVLTGMVSGGIGGTGGKDRFGGAFVGGPDGDRSEKYLVPSSDEALVL